MAHEENTVPIARQVCPDADYYYIGRYEARERPGTPVMKLVRPMGAVMASQAVDGANKALKS